MTGIGMTDPRIGFGHLFEEFSGPLLIGAAYGNGGPALRFGIAVIRFHDAATLARPAWSIGAECMVHFAADTWAAVGPTFHRGAGPFLAGGGIAVAWHINDADSNLGIVASPELALPLRVQANRSFAPTVQLFAR